MDKKPRLQFLARGDGEDGQPQLLPEAYAELFEPDSKDDFDPRQLLAIVRRRLAISVGVTVAVFFAVLGWTLTRTSVYEGRFQVLVEPETGESSINTLTEAVGGGTGSDSNVDYETQIQVLKSSELMAPIVAQLKSRYPDISYESLIGSGRLSIMRLQNTKILEVRYRNSNPEKIEFVLNQIAKNYLRYSLKKRQLDLGQGIQFVENQLPVSKERVDKLQKQLQAFRQQHNLLDPEAQAKDLSNQVSDITQRRLDTGVDLVATQNSFRSRQENLGADINLARASEIVMSSPEYQARLTQLLDLETQILSQPQFKATHPKIQLLLRSREMQRSRLYVIAQEILVRNSFANVAPQSLIDLSPTQKELLGELVKDTVKINELQVRYQALSGAEVFLTKKGRQLAAIAAQDNDLQHKLKVATDSLNRFLNMRETLQIEAAQNAIPWQLISAPVKPSSPISPNVPRNLTMGAIASLLLGLGAALLAEQLDNVFHSPEELRDRAKLPLLGVIPFKKELEEEEDADSDGFSTELNALAQPGKLSQHHTAPFLEAFRSLHTNIRFLNSDSPVRSIAISSAVPAEGKSTISVHLAQAAAAMGQRVLLVDADLRRPQVHHALELPNLRGLSHALAGNVSLKEAIQQPTRWENLYVLTAGQPPPDPTRLLSSKKMQHLMGQFHSIFDLVIYDTPPLLGFADARLLTAHTDGIMLVVGLGKTNRSALIQAFDNLKVSCASILGLVANGVKNYTTSSYDYYERYYSQERDENASERETAAL